MIETTRLPKSDCLNCGERLDAATGNDAPRPGNLTVCVNCSAVMTFDAEMKLTGFTEDECRELLADAGLMAKLVQRVGVVRLYRNRN